jgi:ABC-type dipeptide/oligopeptide/nickel transport system permease component
LLLKRILWLIPVAFGVVTVTFFVARVFPSDPTALYLPPDANPAVRAAMTAKLGLDQPAMVQYFRFLTDLLHGDLGISLVTGRSVTQDLWDRLPATFELGALGLLLAVALGLPLGVWAAVKKGKLPDYVARFISLSGLAMPQFWFGLVLIWVFAVQLGWLPGPQGRLPAGVLPPPRITGLMLVDGTLSGQWDAWWAALRQLILPVFVIALSSAAPIARMTRNAMLESLDSEYIRTAVAMGHSGMVVPFKYALRNALLPTVTTLGGVVSFVFSGVILVEAIFAWPGMGLYALQAIKSSDFTGLQGFVIYAALLNSFVFVLVDVLYVFIDPRTRT